MVYQCVYCKATYDHDSSYKHNAYDCPKVRRSKMKASLIGLIIVCMIGLSGCQMLKDLLPKEQFADGATRAELQLYVKDKVYKYICTVNPESKALADCREVQ